MKLPAQRDPNTRPFEWKAANRKIPVVVFMAFNLIRTHFYHFKGGMLAIDILGQRVGNSENAYINKAYTQRN